MEAGYGFPGHFHRHHRHSGVIDTFIGIKVSWLLPSQLDAHFLIFHGIYCHLLVTRWIVQYQDVLSHVLIQLLDSTDLLSTHELGVLQELNLKTLHSPLLETFVSIHSKCQWDACRAMRHSSKQLVQFGEMVHC
jgi:hypothetical protein